MYTMSTTAPEITAEPKQAKRPTLAELAKRLPSLAELPPVGPFRPSTWRSPVRGPWMTSVFGSALLVGLPIMFVTGLVSYAAYNPRLAGNDTTPTHGLLGSFLFHWITSPSWIYRVSQGTHVILGLVLTPIFLAKLWSVIPKLFEWPPLRSVAHALERISLIMLVGGGVLQFVTGIADIEYFYPWKFSFYDAHFYGAWVFAVGFVVHATLKFGTMRKALRSRSLRKELATSLAETVPEHDEESGLVAVSPAAPTISRRGVLALVGGSSLAVLVLTAGETIRPLQRTALLAPRARHHQRGPNDFEINTTFATSEIDQAATDESWQLELVGPHAATFSRADLLGMAQSTEVLPIACVEGWSTVQTWTGVRLVDLAHAAGVAKTSRVLVDSLEKPGRPFRSATLDVNQLQNPHSLLALKVNGADLSLDHGFPARIIVPGAPGVHNTKWVTRMTFMPI
jgi:DMSO/TMAO reductase YedYZ molybdopterin-dependent catalytic subunit